MEIKISWIYVIRVPYTHPEGLLQSTIIGNILTLRHASIHIHIHLVDLIPRILINDALRSLAECLDGGIVPPLHHVALFVKLPSLIVETVGDLVTDHHTDPTIVQRLGKVLTVEKRLQYASGKDCKGRRNRDEDQYEAQTMID